MKSPQGPLFDPAILLDAATRLVGATCKRRLRAAPTRLAIGQISERGGYGVHIERTRAEEQLAAVCMQVSIHRVPQT